MTKLSSIDEPQIAAFMNRAARAYGRFEIAPDPSVILLRAALANRLQREQRELRAQTLSFAIAALAVALAVLLAYGWVAPALSLLGDAGLISGIALVLVAPAVWLLAVRPLRHAR